MDNAASLESRILQLEKAAQAAAGGLWFYDKRWGCISQSSPNGKLIADVFEGEFEHEKNDANGRYIAEARPAVILNLIQQLRQALNQLKETGIQPLEVVPPVDEVIEDNSTLEEE
jgi:hypothetical protein